MENRVNLLSDSLKLLNPGFTRVRSYPHWGSQDIGISPGGPMDLFAMESGNALLGNSSECESLEILVSPVIEIKQSVLFILTGAHLSAQLKTGDKTTQIDHAVVSFAVKGDILTFKAKTKGFRSYLSFKPLLEYPVNGITSKSLIGKKRGDFDTQFNWQDPDGFIRVVEGPEYGYLKNKDAFFQRTWKISLDSSDMGMRLESPISLSIEIGNMISDAVSDGTVQLTPSGPIILLKHRQTVGGYPRIFNVISADVDLLAQHMPSQVLKFRKITLQEAEDIAILKENQLNRLRF